MNFFITQNSTLPYIRMEVINDGRYDFRKIYYALENADITFSMTNIDNGIKKITNAKAHLTPKESGCSDGYYIEYQWKTRDTKEKGNFLGSFKIKFNNDIKVDGLSFPSGDLIVPIAEKLEINII